MKIKTHDWIQLTLRDQSTTIVKVRAISLIDQDNNFCRVELGGNAIHVSESDKEIMKMILEGVEFDV